MIAECIVEALNCCSNVREILKNISVVKTFLFSFSCQYNINKVFRDFTENWSNILEIAQQAVGAAVLSSNKKRTKLACCNFLWFSYNDPEARQGRCELL